MESDAASLRPGKAPAASEMASNGREATVPTVDHKPSVEGLSGDDRLIVAVEMTSRVDVGLSRDDVTKRVEPDIGAHVTAKGRVGQDVTVRDRRQACRTSTAR